MTQTVEFLNFAIEEHPNKFLMVRVVNDLATHYMNPTGMWVAFPEDVDAVFAALVESGDLPVYVDPAKLEAADGEDDV